MEKVGVSRLTIVWVTAVARWLLLWLLILIPLVALISAVLSAIGVGTNSFWSSIVGINTLVNGWYWLDILLISFGFWVGTLIVFKVVDFFGKVIAGWHIEIRW